LRGFFIVLGVKDRADALGASRGYSGGNTRKIDNLMTDALTIGAPQGKAVIDPKSHKIV